MDAVTPDPPTLRDALYKALSPQADAAVRTILEAGARHGAVYAVGGVVRDMLLGRPIVDIDLATQGDAIDILRAAFPDARLTTHVAFRTASIEAGGTWIDVATARTETYAAPGALPRVTTPAPIEADLARRDFAMNAIALRLDDEPALIDPCGGVADIRAGIVRILHEASFRDDATRIIRAFRYAARLGFTVEPHTRALMERDLKCIAQIGGERLRRELELAVEEPAAGRLLTALADAGVLAAIHPALEWDPRRSAALAASEDAEPDGVALGFALLAATTDPPAADAIIERLRLSREEAAAVRGVAALRSHEAMLRRPDAKPSGITVLLDRYPAASVRAFAATAADPIAAQLALRYLGEWKLMKPILSGEDLIEMGVPEGPQVGRGLALVRAARLDGWATDRGDEHALVLRFVKSIRDSALMRGRIDLDLHVN
jgi:tRNA nucleotidyltransferase (CCA-adding enzyme)